MVAKGRGLCVCFGVCGETTKKKEESKIINVSYEFSQPFEFAKKEQYH